MKLEKVLNKIAFYFLLLLFALKNTVFINTSISNIIFSGIMLMFTVGYIISYKMYNLKKNNVIFLTVLGLVLFQGLFLTYHLKFSYGKYATDVLRYLTFIGIFLFGKFAYNNISSKGLGMWFAIILLYHLITGYYELLFGHVLEIGGMERLSGGFDLIGQFGLMMGLCLILLFIIFKREPNLFLKFAVAILFIMTMGVLAFNNTMRIIVAVGFGFFMFYVVGKGNYKYLIILILLGGGLILINKDVYNRLAHVLSAHYSMENIDRAHVENSFQWRMAQWYLLITDWYKNYFIMGVGLGQQTVLNGFVTPDGEKYVAHSDFVKLLVETGLVGFPFILGLYYSLYKFIRHRCFVEEFQMVFLYFAFCLLTGNTLFSNPMQIFAFLIGFLTMRKKEEIVGA